MLRFNKFNIYRRSRGIKFQYILCYGSTFLEVFLCDFVLNFNTSYVTVQRYLINNNFFGHRKFQYILCYGSTIGVM